MSRKFLCGIFAAIMILNMSIWAVPVTMEESTHAETDIVEEEKPTVDSQGRPILADRESAILIEGSSGVVLYEKDAKKKMYPASTTKIMTALVAMEAADAGEISLFDNVTVTEEMLDGLDIDGSNIALKPGEIMSVENLLKGMLVVSGNDAAMAIAYHVAGGNDAFCQRMNEKATAIGLEGTHFVNPHGLHDDNHYTTASDLAKLSSVAMKNDTFRKMADIAHIKIPPTNMTEKERYYINTNALLSALKYRDYYYKGTTGIKTGTTDAAGSCLVASARRNEMELISVVLNAEKATDTYMDSIRLFDYGFENYEFAEAAAQNEIVGQTDVKWGWSKDTVTLSAVENINVVVPKGTETDKLEIKLNLPENVYAPIKKGDVICTASVFLGETNLGDGALCADSDVSRSFFWPVLAVGEWLWDMLLVRIIVYLGIIALIWLVIVIVIGFVKEYKRSKKQKELRQKRRNEKQ